MPTNICCLGVDYVGVPTSCVLAHMCPTLKVAITDLSSANVTPWTTKQMPSREPGLEEMMKKCLSKNLAFTTDVEGAIKAADLILISSNTPAKSHGSGEDKIMNVSEIEKAARFIATHANNNKIIVEKSTVPVGHNRIIRRILHANNSNVKFQVLSNPEFFSAGTAIQSLMNPTRVLIGSDRTADGLAAAKTLASVYSRWVPSDKIITMTSWSAELSKLSANAFLAQRLSSLSTMSMLCEALGADVSELVKIMGKCSGVGPNYLEPSFGFGGAHLKKDLLCLIYMCERINRLEVAEYWKQVIVINDHNQSRFKKKILSAFFNTLTHKKFAIWGFAFKKDVHVAENSPAIFICQCLLEEGAKLKIYDPAVEKRQILLELKRVCENESSLANVTVCDDPYKAASKTNGIVLCTDWDEFKSLNYASIFKDMMKPAYIFDGRKCLPHEDLIDLGFVVQTIGKEFKNF